ncbi:transmembrane protein 192 [Tachyglossus aculeatus]|uniref:transmembrane protein 192 n=1 Tax=Tachyglossus aculeatus TaxID=9261 RepID=UPI0018F2C24A|nr:transmembrane protein 192 [Tachyglossus aculeatus]
MAGPAAGDGSLDITQSMEDEPLLDEWLLQHDLLQASFKPTFQAIPTVILTNLLLLVHVIFVVLAFLIEILCSYPNPNEDKCPGNYTSPLRVQSVVIIGKIILWILHVLLERYIQHHHSKVRNRGYLMIYRSTSHLKRLSLIILSTGNAAVLLIWAIEHSFPEHAKLYLDFILGVLVLELIGSLICAGIYTVKIRRFNKAKLRPDIIEEEKLYAYPNDITSETGFRTSSSLEEIIEKQGDMIEYLKRHNALLSKRLLTFTSPDSVTRAVRV